MRPKKPRSIWDTLVQRKTESPIVTLGRRFRFSLTTLLVAVALAALWLGSTANRARKQRALVSWVTEMGGHVRYDYHYGEDGKRVRHRGPNGNWVLDEVEPPGPEWLRKVVGDNYFATVALVDLSETEVRDLTPLAEATDLRMLRLTSTQVADLSPLEKLTQLKELALNGTEVTDLSPLEHLTNLEWLFLGGTDCADLSPLEKLLRLRTLVLYNCQATDLSPLVNLKHLEEVSFDEISRYHRKCQLTNEEVAHLRWALPDCVVTGPDGSDGR